MINFRLDENSVNDLVMMTGIDKELARLLCSGENPVSSCTQVYGCYENNELVAIMTATYSIVFPHEDGTRMVHISGAYTKFEYRNLGFATMLLRAIERDAIDCFHADYLCCDSTANELYIKSGFVKAPSDETRLWKQLR